MTLLTVVVPCFNAEAYMKRAIDSLLTGSHPVQIVIVDDGSTDSTGTIADEYAAAFPGSIEVVHKENGGHGSAVNAGLDRATGAYIKIVDSDDWVDPFAYAELLLMLQDWEDAGRSADLVISNFVYEKEGKHRKQAERYTSVMPAGQFIGWDQVKPFRPWQYMLMHSMVYRTEVLRQSGLRLPHHSFYVDNLYAFVPLPEVKTLYYLDVDLYRYYVGRADQSVEESVMIRRIDQQININKEMFRALSKFLQEGALSESLSRYMKHYLTVITLVSSTLCTIHGDPELLAKKKDLWKWMKSDDPALAACLSRGILGRFATLHGPWAVPVTKVGYLAAKATIGFN